MDAPDDLSETPLEELLELRARYRADEKLLVLMAGDPRGEDPAVVAWLADTNAKLIARLEAAINRRLS